MSKPRIIIIMHYMELGGAEMALLGLLYALEPKKIDVDLFIYDHRGPLMEYIPKWVNILPGIREYAMIERPLKEVALKSIKVAIKRLIAKYKINKSSKKSGNYHNYENAFQVVADNVCPVLPKINPEMEYDLCISFLAPHNYGISKVRACKRVAWIHTDYSNSDFDVKNNIKIWEAYNNIISISPEVTNSFVKIFPSLKSKVVEIENILPAEYIRSKAREKNVPAEMTGGINLLSIGRFCRAKNYDNVPDIACRMVQAGLSCFKWYIIGFGIDEALIRQKIAESGMEEYVILLGKKENPYPYIKACDIYVQPSRFEGKSITVREAQVLGKPVAITAYATAPSQINDGIDGVIVPLDNEGCAQGLCDFIANKSLQEKIKEYLSKHDFSGQVEVNKIYYLLGIS